MDVFQPTPPEWTTKAVHAFDFGCPTCKLASTEAVSVWVNRRSPVLTEDYRKRWQEFYQCQCGCTWWAWSSDRPPSEFAREEGE